MLGLSPITYHSLLYRLYSAKRSKYHLGVTVHFVKESINTESLLAQAVRE